MTGCVLKATPAVAVAEGSVYDRQLGRRLPG